MNRISKLSIVFFISITLLSSWSIQNLNKNSWSIKIAGKEVMGEENNKFGDAITIGRKDLTKNTSISAHMYFCGSSAIGSTCTLIITNENGKTIAGKPTTNQKFSFEAELPINDLLANPDFTSAKQLNIAFDIKNSESKELNELYVLGIIKIVE